MKMQSLDFQLQLTKLAAQKLAQSIIATQMYNVPSLLPSTLLASQQPNNTSESLSRKRRRNDSQGFDDVEKSSQSDSSDSYIGGPSEGDFSKTNDIIVPSSDREGWCRNKKYIEQVKNGFMCTVCKKIYGRYNSVSYHVTIYHRNPPIKCDIDGCQFSTREARYIHFHKFYRHHIPLPNTIDLGCRKCPYCTHVSKSPAMLEKHISRHLTEGNRGISPVLHPQCDKETSEENNLLDHLLEQQHQQDNNIPGFSCPHCSYRSQSETSLRQHLLFKHSDDTFERKLSCEVCQYVCAESKMQTHYKERHSKSTQGTDDEPEEVSKSGEESDSHISTAAVSVAV
ncbi:unnamed protein product [Enterobius vermicularis]|uniref:C2H2-type domain-containing protein n=1 Tax=Enterobius vermicularis TaxID=51028 RepID=A0A0N4V8Z2_ENTVE|nr:unnamed protein product [Enterobius vermicularis]